MSVDWNSLEIGPLLGVFGEPFTWSLAGLQPFQAAGVYDEAYQEESLAGGVPVMTTGPAVGIRVSDFPRLPRQGEQCTCIRTGVSFTVRKPKPDSHGHALLLLNALGAPA